MPALVLLAALSVCALAAPSRVWATPYRPFIVSPEAPGSPSAPSGVACDPLGAVYVADTGNDRIAVYATDGAFLRSISGPGPGEGSLSSPAAVALGPEGVYVADVGRSRIAVFGTSGDFVRSIALLAPRGVAVGSDGTVYATAAGVDGVRVFRMDGSQATWGSTGVVNGAFIAPAGVAVGGGGTSLYVADTGNKRVQVLNSSNGAYISQWGPEPGPGGTTVSRYVAPVGVTVAPGGDVIVTDANAHWVQRVQSFGAFLQTAAWGTKGTAGSGEGAFSNPRAAAIAADGQLFVADKDNGRVARVAGTWLPPLSPHSAAAEDFWSPSSVAVDASSALLVADTGNQRIVRRDAEGGVLAPLATGLAAPRAVAALPNGDRLVAETSASVVVRYAAQGSILATYGAGQLSTPGGIAVAEDGAFFVADTGNHRIARFSSAGDFLGSYGSFGSGDGFFSSPTDVALDPSDASMWVADSGNHRVVKLGAADGAFRLKVPAAGGSGTGDGLFVSPLGVGSHPEGGVVVADTGNDRVQRFSRGGAHLETIGSRGVLAGRFHAPVDVAAAVGDRLWVLERDGARLQAFTRDDEAPAVSALGIPLAPVASDVDVTLAAVDATSGVAAVWWRANDSVPETYTGTIRLSAEGTTTLCWWAVDRVGNVSAEQTAAVVIDRTPPSGSFLVGSGAYWNPATPAPVYSEVLDAVEMRVGIGTDFGPWADYSSNASIDLPAVDGRFAVTAEYRDALGNVLRLVQPMGMDRAGPPAPVVTSPTHAADVVVRGQGDAQFLWDEPTDLSGAETYSYVFDREPTTTPVPFPFTSARNAAMPVPEAGEWYFHVRARDVAGNWGPAAHYRVSRSAKPALSAPLAGGVEDDGGARLVSLEGTISPAHGGCEVNVWALRRVGRSWRPVGSTTATLGPGVGGLARYYVTLRLEPGFYRFVAVHPAHVPFESARSALSPASTLR